MFSCDFDFGDLDNTDSVGPDMLIDFTDVLYSDVDLSAFSCCISPTPTEDESKCQELMSPLKSPWSDSDSGVSDILSESGYNEASPTETYISKHELNSHRADQLWCQEHNNSSNYTLKFSLNAENQHLKEKQLKMSNYINPVNSSQYENANKANKLNTSIVDMKVKNSTSTMIEIGSDLLLEKTQNSIAENSLHCPEKENQLHNTSLVALKQEKPRTVSTCVNISTDGEVDQSRKNALQAKLNREKKKAYMKGLEEELATLKNQNIELRCENDTFKLKNAELEEEVEYLKCVLANSSSLSSLLKNIGHTHGVKLSSTITNRKRKLESDTDSSLQSKKTFTGGLCLHVSDTRASLELCAHCSSMAQLSFEN